MPALIGAFSSRRAEIAAALGEGPASPRARAIAWAATRDPKEPIGDPEALRRRWLARAADMGMDVPAARRSPGEERTPSGDGPARGDAVLDEHRFAAALYRGPHGGVTRREVVAAWASAVVPGTPAPAVQRSVDLMTGSATEVGVSETARPPRSVAAAPWQLRALGPRPATPGRFTVWKSAADALDRYRTRWAVDDPHRPLGVATGAGSLARLPPARLAEHLRVARGVDEARRRLGRPVSRESPGPERRLDRA
jgi:hypothetical protein